MPTTRLAVFGLALGALTAYAGTARADVYTLYIHGSFPNDLSGLVDTNCGAYWSNLGVGTALTLYGPNVRCPHYNSTVLSRIVGSSSSARVSAALDSYCTGSNSCYIACHSMGCAQVGYAIANKSDWATNPWHIEWVATAGSAEGGTELCNLASPQIALPGYTSSQCSGTANGCSGSGGLGSLLTCLLDNTVQTAACLITQTASLPFTFCTDMTPTNAVHLYDHTVTHGIPFYTMSGSRPIAGVTGGLTYGRTDGLEPYHSSAGIDTRGDTNYAEADCNPGETSCGAGGPTFYDVTTRPRWPDHYQFFLDRYQDYDHLMYVNPAGLSLFYGIVDSVLVPFMRNNARAPSSSDVGRQSVVLDPSNQLTVLAAARQTGTHYTDLKNRQDLTMERGAWLAHQVGANGAWDHSWAALGGYVTGAPSVIRNADGTLQAFARGVDNALWMTRQASSGGQWNPWVSLGGAMTGDPSPLVATDNREIFVRGTDNQLYYAYQWTSTGAWAWAQVPLPSGLTLASDPVEQLDGSSRVNVFFTGSDCNVYHYYWNSGSWAHTDLGGCAVGEPGVGMTTWNTIGVFARATDNSMWETQQVKPSDPTGGWTTWSALGGAILDSPAVARTGDGWVAVVAEGTDHHLWSYNIWTVAWTQISTDTFPTNARVALGANADGRVELFARNSAGTLGHQSQTTASSTAAWNTWTLLPAQ